MYLLFETHSEKLEVPQVPPPGSRVEVGVYGYDDKIEFVMPNEAVWAFDLINEDTLRPTVTVDLRVGQARNGDGWHG